MFRGQASQAPPACSAPPAPNCTIYANDARWANITSFCLAQLQYRTLDVAVVSADAAVAAAVAVDAVGHSPGTYLYTTLHVHEK